MYKYFLFLLLVACAKTYTAPIVCKEYTGLYIISTADHNIAVDRIAYDTLQIGDTITYRHTGRIVKVRFIHRRGPG